MISVLILKSQPEINVKVLADWCVFYFSETFRNLMYM